MVFKLRWRRKIDEGGGYRRAEVVLDSSIVKGRFCVYKFCEYEWVWFRFFICKRLFCVLGKVNNIGEMYDFGDDGKGVGAKRMIKMVDDLVMT